MLKIVGICILLFAVFCVFGAQRQAQRQRLLLCEELSSFLRFTRRMVGCYLKPPSEIAPLFETDEPEMRAFKEKLTETSDVSQALRQTGICDKIGRRASRLLSDCFESFGRGYLPDELSRLDAVILEFDSLLKDEREKTPERLKLFSTLYVALSLGVLILFI